MAVPYGWAVMLSVIKWTATALLVIGTVINNLGIYPMGAITMSAAGALWLVASVMMRDKALITTNASLFFIGNASLLIGLI